MDSNFEEMIRFEDHQKMVEHLHIRIREEKKKNRALRALIQDLIKRYGKG